MNSKHILKNDELDWLAFRYIAGEMSAEEADVFEARLAVEQDAREAVASAVQLSQAVVSLSSLDQPIKLRPRSRSRQWSAIISLVTVACLMMAFGLLLDRSGRTGGEANLDQHNGEADHLVAVWTEGELTVNNEADSLSEENLLAVAEDQSIDEAFVVPEWLIAAVSTELGPDGEHSDQEQMEN